MGERPYELIVAKWPEPEALDADRLDRHHAMLTRLARLESIQLVLVRRPGAAQIVVDETDAMPCRSKGIIDLDAEKARLSKAAEAAEKERDSLAARLANPNFVERAKPEAVEKARADHAAKSPPKPNATAPHCGWARISH
jgi:valyl-tRNA synthetase